MARVPASEPYSLPVLLLFCIVIVLVLAPLYVSQDSYVIMATQALRGLSVSVVLLPLFLLLAVQLLISSHRFSLYSTQGRPSFSQLGGSSLSIGLLLVITLILIWYHTSIEDSWHPLLRRFSRATTSRSQYYRLSRRRRAY
ncbi:hypothetical protein O6H91_20G071700 [Diphasiastrum complanatum]|uniref:Uncharacterized protein n=1 Tax=Diphasiastrum complanatum TaxID=34168 RepID=A0ACC2ARP8_DIPCM|nr:hypothetical protein O6H91_20G071700 [Diphasiastrum complanatum]